MPIIVRRVRRREGWPSSQAPQRNLWILGHHPVASNGTPCLMASRQALNDARRQAGERLVTGKFHDCSNNHQGCCEIQKTFLNHVLSHTLLDTP
jgi:hypothetical protein